ncbi:MULTISPECIES: SMI1/KNR4 family protein [Priestia]|uniref:SMI1/KNR4 family protein n=1 Tax=Priestia TaxID=2800373 RepID=UPI001C8DBCA1|nr:MULTISPECIES: SMI1/KNR4 family protein [Priestia]MBY0061406.1 SMI1/KNR4 family protein [Priestia aryabhattai]MDN3361937.1 SMI1/KNR4 family protein [Priestia megaterium]
MKKEFYQGDSFWSDDSEYKCIDYPINDEIIKQAEVILGVKLPSSLLDLMKIRNGGGLNYPYFILPDGDAESIPYGGRANINSIDPIHFENDDISILSSKDLLREVKLTGEFVVLWTDFHYWVVLDYRNRSQNPSVMYIAENYSASKYDTTEWEYIKIADNFDDFLKQLFRVLPLDQKQLKSSYRRK